jgi:peptide chain release factor 3
MDGNRGTCAEDHDGKLVFLARNSWALGRAREDFPNIRFTATREQAA